MSEIKLDNLTDEEVFAAFDDICTIFDFEKEIDASSKSAAEVLQFIEDKQSTDDKFNADDFSKDKDGEFSGLTVDTVRTLINGNVTVPEGWAVLVEATPKKEKKAPKAAKTPKAPKAAKTPKEKNLLAGARGLNKKKRLEKMEECIALGTMTKDQIIAEVIKIDPTVTESTVRTELTDQKNPKYRKLTRTVIEKNKIFSFED